MTSTATTTSSSTIFSYNSAAMAISRLITVYVQGPDSTYQAVAHSIPAINLTVATGLARAQLGGEENKITRLILPSTITNIETAKRVCAWLKTNDPKDWRPVTIGELQISDFNDLVIVYATAYAMFIDPEKRGNELRQEIVDYIHASPLTRDEFVMILEVLHFDVGLAYTAKNQIMHLCVKGKRVQSSTKRSVVFTTPEMDQIEAYCKEKGLWCEMEDLEAKIRAKMTAREELRANERRDNSGFQT
ncbi:hypothetical protein LTR78_009683 [Recurvomyces mirabilis]|uniref:Uncharacterized protein n=1 Tax=Recurvomyces mirabilis TaxID=574656 RepID=A0AAE0TNG2_9PEZI|nr:hypothetical protein LTR78_009683 [Recurvomyces mirabilis]KAK5150276.1 hypothetical protein LTS14_010252 [Recurvomyces mirabilis]